MAATEQFEAAIGAHLVGGLDAPSAEDAMRTASRTFLPRDETTLSWKSCWPIF